MLLAVSKRISIFTLTLTLTINGNFQALVAAKMVAWKLVPTWSWLTRIIPGESFSPAVSQLSVTKSRCLHPRERSWESWSNISHITSPTYKFNIITYHVIPANTLIQSISQVLSSIRPIRCKKQKNQGVPVGAVVEKPPANTGETGSIPGPGRFQMLRSS